MWKWIRQLEHRTLGGTLPTKSTLRAAAAASTKTEQLLPIQPSHHDTMQKKYYQRDSEQHQHNGNIPDIEGFICRKLTIINECTTVLYMHRRWGKVCSVLHCKWNNSWLRDDDLCHHSWVTRKDSGIIWSTRVVQQVMSFTLRYYHFE